MCSEGGSEGVGIHGPFADMFLSRGVGASAKCLEQFLRAEQTRRQLIVDREQLAERQQIADKVRGSSLSMPQYYATLFRCPFQLQRNSSTFTSFRAQQWPSCCGEYQVYQVQVNLRTALSPLHLSPQSLVTHLVHIFLI